MTIHSAAPARLFPWARNRAKRVLVRSDMWRHRRDPAIRGWKPVLAGARVGHIVVPSKALTTSRAEAADFVASGLIAGGDRVLDVGAGNGRQAIGLLEAGIREYVGLDVVRGSVDWANQAFHSMNLPARFHLLDVVNGMYNPAGTITPTQVTFPYGDAEFDCVLAGSLYTHLESMDVVRLYIAETARVCDAAAAPSCRSSAARPIPRRRVPSVRSIRTRRSWTPSAHISRSGTRAVGIPPPCTTNGAVPAPPRLSALGSEPMVHVWTAAAAQRARSAITSAPGICASAAPGSTSFDPRMPEPITTRSASSDAARRQGAASRPAARSG